MRRLLMVMVVCSVAWPAAAAPVLDGTKDASYGAPRAVQTVQTGFGDNFSELDAVYGRVENNVLYLMLTGNLERNGNCLDIFIDSNTGGQNTLLNDANTPNNPNDVWGSNFAGFTFDSGFSADYLLTMRVSPFPSFNIQLATINGGAGAFEGALNVFGGSDQGSNASALPLAGIGVASNNSNAAGVGGTATSAADPIAAAAVTTGTELAIPLSAIGNPTLPIKISAMINGSGSPPHGFLSNQFAGGLPVGTNNLGGPGGVNLANISGDQFFTIPIPEPSSLALLSLAFLVGLIGDRRQR